MIGKSLGYAGAQSALDLIMAQPRIMNHITLRACICNASDSNGSAFGIDNID